MTAARTGDRPCYLVVTPGEAFAVRADESVVPIGPDAAVALAGSRDPGVDALPVAAADGGFLSPPCPLALAVLDDRVQAWSPVLGRRVDVGADQMEALASPTGGVAVDGDWGRRLLPLAAAGVLRVGPRPDPSERQPGFLQPTAAAPPRDLVGAGRRQGAVPVHMVCASHIAGVPLGLGMLAAAVHTHDGGRLLRDFDLRPVRREVATTLEEVSADPVPAVLMCSNYVWSAPDNLELSRRVKELAPGSVTVHGGPSTPKYAPDVEAFLRDHPHVDVMVLGEGEVTVVEVLEALGPGLDVDAVAGVPGTIVRRADGTVVHGPRRDRVADLGSLASPYLLGLFDHLDGGLLDMMPLETNRGCPYACAFCDWGSATNSRIRKFPRDRVRAELEWIARRGVGTLFIADANFGILPRDLDLAHDVVEVRQQHGAPHTVLVSFAKNQTYRAVDIVRSWIEGGVVTEGSIALQTSDGPTLEAISRKNIRVERYDELTAEFQRLELPMAVDLMVGLPGATTAAFRGDLQRCIDGELTARIYPTVVLPNSPMNEPGYRVRHRIRTDRDGIVVACASFSEADHADMLRLRRVYRAADHFGVLRHVARFAQRDHGVPATDLYQRIADLTRADPGSWPGLTWVGRHLARWTVPPPGWQPVLDEVQRLLVDGFGLPDDGALRTSLAVQEAHLPVAGACFPRRVQLDHDYVGWWRDLDGPAAGPLAERGPGVLEVDDPRGICGANVRSHLRAHEHPDLDNVTRNEFWIAGDWELESPLTRPLPQVLAARVAAPS